MVPRPSILISDDDPALRETLHEVFEPEGFRTFLAQDGEEALEIARDEEIHVVLTDLHMPKLSGLEVLRLLRQIDALLPCILMSADWDDSLLRQARLLKAFSTLAKPVRRREITTLAQRALAYYNRLDSPGEESLP